MNHTDTTPIEDTNTHDQAMALMLALMTINTTDADE